MDKISITFDSIDANNNISPELKENFKELLTIFYENFNDIDLNNFNNRIKKMKVQKGNKYITKDAIEYNPSDNILYINESKLKKVDAKHELMFSILTIISAKDNYYGFDTDGRLKTLNVGITEILTNFLVGNEEESI